MRPDERVPDRARIDDLIAGLSELRSDDPAAGPAMRAIKLTRITVESFRGHPPDDR